AEDYTEALKADPKRTDALYGRALCRKGLEDFKAAKEDLDALLEIDPKDADGWEARGGCLYHLQDVEGQKADYRKALEVAPKDWSRRKAIQDWLDAQDK